jgi:hypothetical protein
MPFFGDTFASTTTLVHDIIPYLWTNIHPRKPITHITARIANTGLAYNIVEQPEAQSKNVTASSAAPSTTQRAAREKFA